MIDKNSVTIALNGLYVKKDKIYPAYVSKHNSNREKQVIFLMILNGEKRHYLAVKKLLELLRGITSKHRGDFHCLNCFILSQQKNNLNRIKKYVKIKIFVK